MACVCALLLAGCGGDRGPSRAAFARGADAICRSALARLSAVKQRIDEAATGTDAGLILSDSARLLREGAGVSRAAADRIAALEKPREAADAIDAWVASNRRQAAQTEALAAAFRAGDQARIGRLSATVGALEQRNNATARGFGMRSCAEPVPG